MGGGRTRRGVNGVGAEGIEEEGRVKGGKGTG